MPEPKISVEIPASGAYLAVLRAAATGLAAGLRFTYEEIDACEVEPWASEVARRRGFRIRGHQADIFGVCANCQAAERQEN